MTARRVIYRPQVEEDVKCVLIEAMRWVNECVVVEKEREVRGHVTEVSE